VGESWYQLSEEIHDHLNNHTILSIVTEYIIESACCLLALTGMGWSGAREIHVIPNSQGIHLMKDWNCSFQVHREYIGPTSVFALTGNSECPFPVHRIFFSIPKSQEI